MSKPIKFLRFELLQTDIGATSTILNNDIHKKGQ